MTEFFFDRDKHEYYVDRERWPSITDCMRSSGIIDPNQVSDYHLWVGTATHRAIELYIRGVLNIETLDPELKPRLVAWDEFTKGTGFVPEGSEISRYNPTLRFCGTLDVLGHFPDGQEGIVEIKSGNVSKWAGVQTAGQDILLGGKYRKRYGLKIPAEGRPVVRPFTDIDDYNVFRACVTITNWKTK